MARTDRRAELALILFDVDGVLTDGTLLIGPDGEALKPFNVHDGIAVGLLRHHAIQSGVLSAKSSAPLLTRANQLGMDVIKTGFQRKLDALQQIVESTGIPPEQIGFVGDDVIDIPVMQRVGVAYAPRDAHPLVREQADFVCHKTGGNGVAREVAEDLLVARGFDLNAMYAHLTDDDDALLSLVQ
ncbi:KdsC family phosphatase [Salinicola aestuarinus]|uniref:KdsC family phosphatase n=1 Tax=Salinicola aestuarinus TaxID=1949082 RepID=UPI000DA18676|nr:HAD hydrolase family protein [Salinicola aestuarinus]